MSDNVCYGCGGKGWVDSQYAGAMKCPVCNGAGVLQVVPVDTSRETLERQPFWPPPVTCEVRSKVYTWKGEPYEMRI